MTDKKPKIIMFGASKAGESFISHVKANNKYEILAIADNDEIKQNSYFFGYPVIAPAKILDFEYDFIMITSTFVLQIQDQLINELKIDNSKIKAMPKSIMGAKESYRPFEDEKTMDLARNTLMCIIDLFELNNIPYFIDHGTLLGIVRDGDLLPWDDDIDISIYSEDTTKTISCIENNISKLPMNKSLRWVVNVYYQENLIPNEIEITFDPINQMNFKKILVSIKPVFFENEFAVQRVTYAPEYHFRKREHVNYKGRNISTPYDYERYLEYHYGEWKIPKKQSSLLDIYNYKEPVYTYKKEIAINRL